MWKALKYTIGAFALIYIIFLVKIGLVDIPALRILNPDQTAIMRAKGVSQELTWKNFETIPFFLKRAILAAEDSSFYQHHGIDYNALKNAYKQNVKKKKYARGGSTITMQLAKNLYLSSRKSLLRKTLEVLLAYRLEQELTKDRILEIYLNVIEFGDQVFGVGNAARYYFKKPLEDLDEKELSFLVAIVPSPKKWGHWPPGPYVSKRMAVISKRVGRVASGEPHASPVPLVIESALEPIELTTTEEEEEKELEGPPTPQIFLDE